MKLAPSQAFSALTAVGLARTGGVYTSRKDPSSGAKAPNSGSDVMSELKLRPPKNLLQLENRGALARTRPTLKNQGWGTRKTPLATQTFELRAPKAEERSLVASLARDDNERRERSRVQSRTSVEPPLEEYYRALFSSFGPQHWWPGETQFEVIVGAILTQNTSWTNVERAIANLRGAKLLSPAAIARMPLGRLEQLIRSSGYFRQKARKLKAFCDFLGAAYGGSLKKMFETPTATLREQLLGVFGIGPETADSILLYAGQHGVFVADAYTKRLLARHGWVDEKTSYEEVRSMVERQFPGDVERFNEFHALIVSVGKQFCRPRQPLCGECPLGPHLEEGR